jgi:PAS domain S-box-containing protein
MKTMSSEPAGLQASPASSGAQVDAANPARNDEVEPGSSQAEVDAVAPADIGMLTRPGDSTKQPDIAALALAEQRYRALVRATSSLVWTRSADGQIVDMPEWRTYTGQSIEQVKGWGWLDALHPDDRERTAAAWQQAVNARSFYETEYRIRRSDGAYVWHRARGVPILEPDGSVREWVGVCLDIQQRKRAEEKRIEAETTLRRLNEVLYRDLAEREAQIRRLVDANIIGIFIWDLEGRIIEANDTFLRMVGYDHEDIASDRMRWTDLAPPQWRDRGARADEEVKRTGRFQSYEKQFFRKDGSRVPVLIGSAAFDEQRDQGVAFVLDLTDRKRAEAAMRESERRYREVQAELAHANRVATMGQLTASIVHEVNQPIAATLFSAKAALRWLGAQPPNIEEIQQALGRIVKAGNRARDVIGRIRALVKKAPPRKDDVEINEAILEVMALTHGEVVEHGVSVQTQFAESLPLIQGDRIQLQQVILNLIVNAVEAMSGLGEGSRELLISTAKAGSDGVLVAVRDSGPGLARANLERLFEAFYTTKPGGLGMGLSICRSIIEAHAGRLWASAGVPQGAIFQFMLPARPGLSNGSR